MTDTKIALVTGATAGIGAVTAIALAKHGFDLVLAGRRVDRLEEVAGKVRAEGCEALAVPTDVGDPQSVDGLFAKIRERFGRLDVLFNNAGIGAPPVGIEDLPFAQWKAVVDTNLTGAFLCTQGAVRMMKAQSPRGGRIINNGSISAHTPRPNSAPYTSTKHAMTGLTKSTALDGRKYDVACGQIDIGNADTDMGGRMKAGVPQAHGAVLPEDVMDPQHVADAVVYMAGLPLASNVLFMTVMATKMPFVGRG